MTHQLETVRAVYTGSFVKLRINTGNGSQIHDCSPSQPFPCIPQKHGKPCMGITVQKFDRLGDRSEILKYGIYHTGVGKQTKCYGIYQNPADKVRKRCQCLYHILKPFAFDLIEKDCKQHRKHRCCNTQ